jgi:hypothetical protein
MARLQAPFPQGFETAAQSPYLWRRRHGIRALNEKSALNENIVAKSATTAEVSAASRGVTVDVESRAGQGREHEAWNAAGGLESCTQALDDGGFTTEAKTTNSSGNRFKRAKR